MNARNVGRSQVLRIAVGALLSLSLGACGGGPNSSPTAGIVAPPGATASPQPGLAAADVNFVVPPTTAVHLIQSKNRRALYVSPATTNFTVVKDGAVAISQASAFANTSATTADGSMFTVTSTAQTAGQLVDVHFTTLPGTHTIGIVTTDDEPRPNLLSEGQATWILSAGDPPSNNQTLTLAGVAATGYIVCPTIAEIADPSGTCSNFANFSGGAFNLVAVAGDADGYPIYFQSGVAFDNGQVNVVETTAGGDILNITSSGPWSSPGSSLTVDGLSAGNAFSATCARVGTASLALAGTNGRGTVTGFNYSAFTLPPAASTLPQGPSVIANLAIPPNVQAMCSAGGTLTLVGVKRTRI
jgi:hypothetical protein